MVAKDTHNHLLEGTAAGFLLIVIRAGAVELVVVLAQVVSGNVRSPWDPEVEASHQGDAGKTFSLSGAPD